LSSQDPIHEAADLAERILDEVASVDQDWSTIAGLARELAEFADRAAGRPHPPPGSPPPS
jgi:hypothetical protein